MSLENKGSIMKPKSLIQIILLILCLIPITAFSGEWTPMKSGTTHYLLGIWGTSETDVVVVGENGIILHYDGTKWSPHTSEITNHLYGIWGSSGTDVFAVGERGIILYYSGQTTCSTWADVIAKYRAYKDGQANLRDVIDCYREWKENRLHQ